MAKIAPTLTTSTFYIIISFAIGGGGKSARLENSTRINVIPPPAKRYYAEWNKIIKATAWIL